MPDPAATTDATGPDRGSCRVSNWTVFGPGTHKSRFYSPAEVATIAANFARLRGHLRPQVKIGHDSEQELVRRLQESVGFLSMGRVVGCRLTPAGEIALDLDGVPVEVGAQINAGRLNSGSVELLTQVPDPADPARKLPGSVLTGVALLGEEQPAVKGFPPPRATFADGTPVPPAASAAEWLSAMGAVAKTFSERGRPRGRQPHVRLFGHDCPATVIAFSEMHQPPEAPRVDAATIAAALQADPSLKDAVMAIVGGQTPPPPAAPPAVPQQMGDDAKPKDDQPPAWFKAFADDCGKQFGAMTQRMGALEAAKTEDQQKSEAAQMSAFAAEATAVVDAVIGETQGGRPTGRVLPCDRDRFVKEGTALLAAKTFSSDADRRAAFAAWEKELRGRPATFAAATPPAAKKDAVAVPLTPEGRELVKAMSVTNPRLADRLAAG